MKILFCAIAISVLLTACGPICRQQEEPRLDGTAWILTTLDGQDIQLPEATEPPSISFAAGMARGTDGCNRFQGSYEQKNGRLTFGPLASTRRFCPEPVAGVGQGFNQALTVQTGYRLLNGRLELLIGEDVLAKFSAAAEKAKSHSK